MGIMDDVSSSSMGFVLLFSAVCLVIGFLFGAAAGSPIKSPLLRFFYKRKSVERDDDDDDDEEEEEDDDNRKKKTKKKKKIPLVEIEKLAEILEDFKMVLVVRNDLKMGKGKIAAQCSHATLGLYKKLLHRAPKALNRWEMCGQVKVVLKTESEDDLLLLQERAKSMNIPTHVTIDAGRTQIAPNSRTVMAVLGPADLVDEVTGALKLL